MTEKIKEHGAVIIFFAIYLVEHGIIYVIMSEKKNNKITKEIEL